MIIIKYYSFLNLFCIFLLFIHFYIVQRETLGKFPLRDFIAWCLINFPIVWIEILSILGEFYRTLYKAMKYGTRRSLEQALTYEQRIAWRLYPFICFFIFIFGTGYITLFLLPYWVICLIYIFLDIPFIMFTIAHSRIKFIINIFLIFYFILLYLYF